MASNTKSKAAPGSMTPKNEQPAVMKSIEEHAAAHYAQEVERSPSPLIKKEKYDTNTYSSHLIQDDEDDNYEPPPAFSLPMRPVNGKRARSVTPARMAEPMEAPKDDDGVYRPSPEPMMAPASAASQSRYNPAKPTLFPRQPIKYDPDTLPANVKLSNANSERRLNEKGGNLFEPPTVCFTALYRNQPLVHILNCHGEVTTERPEACGTTCRVTEDAETKGTGNPIHCTHAYCVYERERKQASVFMPNKRARTATPAFGARISATPQPNGRYNNGRYNNGRYKPQVGQAAVRRSNRIKTHDEYVAELNDRVANEPGYATIAENAPSMWTKSKKHPGYAYRAEIKEDAAAERVFNVTGGLDINLDDKPKLKREMKKLKVDGTEKLRGMGGTFGLRRKAEDDAAAFAAHDKPFGADLDKDRPWSYAMPRTHGQKSIRNQESPFHTISETRYQEMIEEENGVVIEREDTISNKLPRNAADTDDANNEEEDTAGFQTIEACRVCEVAGDGQLEECTVCHYHFHAVCAGSEDSIGGSDAVRAQDEYELWICDGEGCDKSLSGVRYKCMNIACRDFDYCLECYQKKSAAHVMEMAEQGEDPTVHRFIPVRNGLAEAVRAAKNAQEFVFVCSTCKDSRYAQNIWNEMFGKRTLAVGDIQTKVNKERKAEKKALEKHGVTAEVRKRVEDKRKSGISKPPTPLRRSSRGVSPARSASSARSGLKIKLHPKAMAELMATDKDSPEVVAAKAAVQLPTIQEETDDMDMGDLQTPVGAPGEGDDEYEPGICDEM